MFKKDNRPKNTPESFVDFCKERGADCAASMSTIKNGVVFCFNNCGTFTVFGERNISSCLVLGKNLSIQQMKTLYEILIEGQKDE